MAVHHDERERRGNRLVELRNDALKAIDPVVGAGLERREGHFLHARMVPRVEDASDFVTWQWVVTMLGLLGVRGVPTSGLCVCGTYVTNSQPDPLDGCQLVFRPRRKGQARYCRLCEKRKPAPPLGLGHKPLMERGDRARVSVPKLDAGPGRAGVSAWLETTIGICPECNKPFHGRSDKKTCSKACKEKRARRATD